MAAVGVFVMTSLAMKLAGGGCTELNPPKRTTVSKDVGSAVPNVQTVWAHVGAADNEKDSVTFPLLVTRVALVATVVAARFTVAKS